MGIEEAEWLITGRSWKDCPLCGKVRIPFDQAACQGCGGPVTNCRTCGQGSRWWSKFSGRCSTCDGDPHVAGSGRSDWKDWQGAQFVNMFGSRMPGDEELLARYRNEIRARFGPRGLH